MGLQGEAFTKQVTFQSTATADGNGTVHGVIGYAGCAIDVRGTWDSAVLNFEGSIDGTNYEPLMAVNLETGDMESTAIADGVWFINCAGLSLIRVRLSSAGTTSLTAVGRLTTVQGNLPALRAELTVDSIELQLDDTDKLSVSLWGKDSAAGDVAVNVSTAGNLEIDIVATSAIQLDDTDKLAVSLYGKETAAGDKELNVSTAGNLEVDIVATSAIQLDDTDKLAVSLYGKETASGDKELNVSTAGNLEVDIVATSAIQLDDTDKLAVSLYGKETASGDKELNVSTAGNLEVDIVATSAIQLDDTDKLAVSLYGKETASGDKELNVSTAGNLEVDIVATSAIQLDDTDKLAVSLYGKETAAGDKEINVSTAGNLEIDIVAASVLQLDDTDKLAVSLYGKETAAGDKEVNVSTAGNLEVDIHVGGVAPGLDNTDVLRVSLYGTDSVAGDQTVAVNTSGAVRTMVSNNVQVYDWGFVEGGVTELIGVDEQVDQNEFGGSVAITLATMSGAIKGVTLMMSVAGAGASIREAGWLYFFDADPAISVGDTTLASAAIAQTCLGGVAVAAADWSPVAGSHNVQAISVDIPFHQLTDLYVVYFHEGATSFNDGAGDDETLHVNIWVKRQI